MTESKKYKIRVFGYGYQGGITLSLAILNYKQQLNIIEGLFVPPDTLMRVDCPFCKNKNTLSIDTTENNIRWYCFHASCKAKGKKQGEKNMDYVKKNFRFTF